MFIFALSVLILRSPIFYLQCKLSSSCAEADYYSVDPTDRAHRTALGGRVSPIIVWWLTFHCIYFSSAPQVVPRYVELVPCHVTVTEASCSTLSPTYIFCAYILLLNNSYILLKRHRTNKT